MAHTIIDLHLSVWSPVLNSRDVTGKDVIEFSKKFEKLREALSCSVCNQLLTNRDVLSPTKCKEHFVCKACKGKKRNDSRKCNLCDDWNTFSVDEDLNDIIKSYQGFCFYFLTNPQIRRVLEVKQEVDPNFNPDKLIDLIAEGLKGLPIGEKRKLSSTLNENRGVIPLDVPIKRKKTASKATAVDRDALENELKTSIPDAVKEIKAKADAKKSLLEAATTQDKTPKIPPNRALSEAKAANKIPVSSGPSPAVKISVPAVSTPPPRIECPVRTVPSTPEPIIASVRTPPPVQVKVEASTPLTTPEKQHPSRNASPIICATNVSRSEKMPDPLEDPFRSQPRLPMFTAPPRPMVSTSFISSVSGTSTTPSLAYRFAGQSIVSSQPSGGPQIIQISHPTGVKTISIRPQQFRLAGVAGVPGGRMPVQILGTATTASGLPNPTSTTNNIIREAIITTSTPGAAKGKTRYLFATANPHELQRWPDTSRLLQLTANDLRGFSTMTNIRPGLFSVAPSALHQIQGLRISSSSSTVRPAVVTSTTVSLVRPSNSVTAAATRCASPIGPHVSEVSSSSTHGATKYTPSTQVQFIRTMAPTSAATVGSVVQPQGFTTSTATITRQVPSSSSPSPSTANPIIQLKRKSEGCRCGNATPTPGKLTCIGQRCACYADRNACSDCKCKGCKNPYVPGSGGKKVLQGQGVRALIDPHTNQAIPIIATSVGPPGSCSATATVLTSNQNVTSSTSIPAALMSTVGHSGGFGHIQTGSTSSVGQPMPPFQLIPVRFGPSGIPQYIQISNPHALQQMPIILSSSGQMQTNSPSGITIQGLSGISGLNNPGIHHLAQFQQQQQQPRISQVNVKNDRSPQHKD